MFLYMKMHENWGPRVRLLPTIKLRNIVRNPFFFADETTVFFSRMKSSSIPERDGLICRQSRF